MILLSNSILPKEQQSAYQRWEMASFGDERPSAVAARKPPVVAPTLQEVAKIRADAQSEAYALGRATGLEDGYAEGLAQGMAQALAEGREQAARELDSLRQIAQAFGAAVTSADAFIAQDMLDLTLDLSKAMLKTALIVRPELLLATVRDAVDHLPILQQPALMYLHPDDILLVKEHIGDELSKAGWRLLEDAEMERGGCRLDTASNQIDASPSSRWQRLAAALGSDIGWLTP
jgi:flagellar assembly protein FliH